MHLLPDAPTGYEAKITVLSTPKVRFSEQDERWSSEAYRRNYAEMGAVSARLCLCKVVADVLTM